MKNNLFKNKPDITEIDPIKILYNVGCMMDIPTGTYLKGVRGENILNGGLSILTGICGRGNVYKSTLTNYMLLSAADKVMQSGINTYVTIYDTEINVHLDRISNISKQFDSFKDIDIYSEGIVNVSDKSKHSGNDWYKKLKEFLRTEKYNNRKSYTFDTPFADTKGQAIKTLFPTFGSLDSISEFDTDDIYDLQDKNAIGESGGKTIHMQIGLAKTRLLMELPGLCNKGAHYMVMTAHVGTEIFIPTGHASMPPPKKLQFLKQGEKLKGVTDKFFFLPNLFWQSVNSSLLNNQSTKGPEYPKTREQTDAGSQDLNIVTVKLLRNKSGSSGDSLNIIVSQIEGVLPSLSEFHYIKDNSRFGIEGSLQSYNLILYPDVKLQRTTVRSLIDTTPRLRRAIKITSDLLQMKEIYKQYNIVIPEVSDLYTKLAKTYDWNILLDTRDFWTFNNYDHPVPFLSTLDIVEMYHDRYVPYWYKPKKGVNKL